MKSIKSRSFSDLAGYPSRLGGGKDEEGLYSLREEGYVEIKVATSFADYPEAPQAPNLALYNKPLFSQSAPSLLKMIKKMTKFMGHLTKAVSPSDTSQSTELQNLSINAPDSFDGTQAHTLRALI
ncbi:hypothetical protein O181_113909 [Austropuccinia psidii MF-1]|uniref:Uncharacterized protein n=1 Tax=Austropuccinia psidii MF-1 TaxID=1389203 RepID=A0A9Q3K6T5_9BASI|nr:hypothetical protein [Austropuccinia psidii MF-1]